MRKELGASYVPVTPLNLSDLRLRGTHYSQLRVHQVALPTKPLFLPSFVVNHNARHRTISVLCGPQGWIMKLCGVVRDIFISFCAGDSNKKDWELLRYCANFQLKERHCFLTFGLCHKFTFGSCQKGILRNQALMWFPASVSLLVISGGQRDSASCRWFFWFI